MLVRPGVLRDHVRHLKETSPVVKDALLPSERQRSECPQGLLVSTYSTSVSTKVSSPWPGPRRHHRGMCGRTPIPRRHTKMARKSQPVNGPFRSPFHKHSQVPSGDQHARRETSERRRGWTQDLAGRRRLRFCNMAGSTCTVVEGRERCV